MTKGGRPQNGEKERRSDHLHVRLTTIERAKLDAESRRLGMPVSRYVRRLIHKPRLAERQAAATPSPATVAALNRIGNNLNQLARHANAKGDLAPIARHVDGVMAKLEKAITALLDRPS